MKYLHFGLALAMSLLVLTACDSSPKSGVVAAPTPTPTQDTRVGEANAQSRAVQISYGNGSVNQSNQNGDNVHVSGQLQPGESQNVNQTNQNGNNNYVGGQQEK